MKSKTDFMLPLKTNKYLNMKKIFLAMTIAAFGFANAQSEAYNGDGDVRLNIGANFQDGGTGIQTSLDFGLGQSFSLGVQGGYLLGVKEYDILGKPKFEDRFDVKARANAHLGDVIGLPENFDLYPGLNLGLKNFGAHLGSRYFFGNGFGVFGELQFPLARYNTDATNYQYLNNQFAVVLGASFDLNAN